MTRKIKITNTLYPDSIPNGTVMTITSKEPNGCLNAVKDGDSFPWFIDAGTFHVLDDTTTLWRDMTDAEKGALLLAKHDGKVIEVYYGSINKWMSLHDYFHDTIAYRVKPEPVRDTATIYGHGTVWSSLSFTDDTHKITFDTVDGTPDTSSIRMDPVS